jgi:hypothetical protein
LLGERTPNRRMLRLDLVKLSLRKLCDHLGERLTPRHLRTCKEVRCHHSGNETKQPSQSRPNLQCLVRSVVVQDRSNPNNRYDGENRQGNDGCLPTCFVQS